VATSSSDRLRDADGIEAHPKAEARTYLRNNNKPPRFISRGTIGKVMLE